MFLESSCGKKDFTIDTNVLVHATNPKDDRFESGVVILEWLRDCSVETKWVLDNQGKSAPNPQTSVLYKEYRERLHAQSTPLILLGHFLRTNRVHFAQRPSAQVLKQLRTHVPKKTSDQAILGAAHGSASKLLVSNDYDDFSKAVRKKVLKDLKVIVVDSDEAAS